MKCRRFFYASRPLALHGLNAYLRETLIIAVVQGAPHFGGLTRH